MMKKAVNPIALMLAVTVLISLCACASSNPEAEAAAGTYNFYAVILDGYYVNVPEFEGRTTVLKADGGGSLDWGDDNQGPISEWTIDGEKVVIKAGVSVMNAALKDGILIVELDNDTMPMSLVFTKDGADTSSIPRISTEEYAAKIGAE